MKIIFVISLLFLMLSCSDFEAPTKDEIKDTIVENVNQIGIDKYKEKIASLKDSVSTQQFESLRSHLEETGKYLDTRIWRWVVEIDSVVREGNIDQAYSIVSQFESLSNIEEYEKDLLKYIRMALDNRSGKSDVPILKVMLESDIFVKYGDEIGTVIMYVAIIAFNPHGGMF